MQTKTILRVEWENGNGMFRQDYGEPFHIMTIAPYISRRHQSFPTPDEEDLDVRKGGKEWFCAYKSIKQFNAWVMAEEMTSLIEAGYRILLLEVEEYQQGKYQILYTKESIISSKVVTEIFK